HPDRRPRQVRHRTAVHAQVNGDGPANHDFGVSAAALIRNGGVHMSRMKGVEPNEAGWFTRLAYWFVKRNVGKLTGRPWLLEPVKIAAHHPRLLRAIGQMEGGQAAAKSVPDALKSLASIKAATLVGCPF